MRTKDDEIELLERTLKRVRLRVRDALKSIQDGMDGEKLLSPEFELAMALKDISDVIGD